MKTPMTKLATSRRRGTTPARLRLFAVRALAAHLLLCAMGGVPALFRHAPELEGPLESSAIAHEFACERAGHTRLRTKASSGFFQRTSVPAEGTGITKGRPSRGVAPRWLRHDLRAPLLC